MLNVVSLVGRITKELELKNSYNHVSLVKFSLAVKRDFKNQKGEYETDFINCVAWRKTAEYLCKFVKKGNLISIVGSFRTNNYENNEGKMVYSYDIFCEKVSFLSSPNTINKEIESNNNEKKKIEDEEEDEEEEDYEEEQGMSIEESIKKQMEDLELIRKL